RRRDDGPAHLFRLRALHQGQAGALRVPRGARLLPGQPARDRGGAATSRSVGPRSEEHTSELQSRGHLVCRLLLEKKKTKKHVRRIGNEPTVPAVGVWRSVESNSPDRGVTEAVNSSSFRVRTRSTLTT